ncbi:hypothetical protein [Actinoallomurus rhizosphaericola]|uniref:hypothetical protein n=1 Tax=Actinoallomurus rhizosphaericola TaxID=2952536 RepID=UPI002092D5D8|nr:hypothetical protein [Actinoallomurus rhizosphaericola]MCO5999019.1 hypothetical protein [Actinoallomurus rhizosphaericola]
MAQDPRSDEGHTAATPVPAAGAPTSTTDDPDPDLTVTHAAETARAVEPPETPRTEQLEGTLTRELRPTRVVPRWAGWLIIGAGVAMLPWITGLSFVLPTSHEAAHYNASWVGFDLGLCAMLLRTGWLAQKGREHIELSAAITGTLLLVDAWFDVVTADSRGELTFALILALFGELPLAAFFLWIAGRVEYRRQRRAEAMARLLKRLRTYRPRAVRAPDEHLR